MTQYTTTEVEILGTMEPGTKYLTSRIADRCGRAESHVESVLQYLTEDGPVDHFETECGFDMWTKQKFSDELPSIFDEDEPRDIEDDVEAIADAALLEIEERDADAYVIGRALAELETEIQRKHIPQPHQ